MEISEFIKTRKQFPILPSGYKESAEWEESQFFNAWIKKYPESKHKEIIERLKYIRSYALLFPEYDGEQWVPSQDAINHYDNRGRRIDASGLSQKEFYEFDILQDAIKELGLSPIATFEFIAFIWRELSKWLYRGTIERMEDRVNRLMNRIDERPNDKMELDIKVGSKHFKFANQQFIKSLIASFINSNLESANQVEIIYPAKREIDYILVRTILQYLPISHKKQKKGAFTQAERNLGLCVLWLTGELNHKKGDDPTDFCTKDNNATFDKLIRDYKDMPLPIISPLF
ncbi:hypothetical protein [Muribaculum intestinale]|uniref:hypothetical protein n=1 Tax=Muribaculum intestinale TaxID=1796646 RepID=UPI0025A9AA55|nr:hypothetical protein [Muribaculum intestinale]